MSSVAEPPRDVVICTAVGVDDVHFDDGAIVLARSLDQYGPPWPRYCLHDGLSDSRLDRLAAAGWQCVFAESPDVRIGSVPSRSAWLRCLIPNLFEAPFALYLDSDLMAVRSLDAINDWPALLRRHQAATAWAPEDEANDYFNSGVILMDLDLWRSNNIAGTAIRLGKEFEADPRSGDNHPFDQVILNQVCRSFGIVSLERRFNVTPGRLTDDPPVIVHFRGPKPWQQDHEISEAMRVLANDAFRHYAGIWRKQLERPTGMLGIFLNRFRHFVKQRT